MFMRAKIPLCGPGQGFIVAIKTGIADRLEGDGLVERRAAQ
jgi:hypothetical protein